MNIININYKCIQLVVRQVLTEYFPYGLCAKNDRGEESRKNDLQGDIVLCTCRRGKISN